MTAPPLDVSGRPLAQRPVDLDRLFRPRSVAVVGASDTEGSAAAMNFRLLRSWLDGRDVRLYPVNPNRDTVDGLPCHASLLDVPDEVDVAVLLVGARSAVAAVADAIEKKAAFAVLFGAGFAESGAEGAALQDRIRALVAGSELHLLGPNTTLNALQPFRDDLPGRRIALITQSGHQGRPLYQAQEIGVPVAAWAPTGNEADLETADFVRYFADRDDVGAIAGYIEGFKDGRSLALAADHAAHRGVPLVLVKVGRTDLGRSWAQSHSGHLAGSDAVVSGFLRQYGATRVDTLDELLDVSAFLARAGRPAGDGVAIYSISGGTGAHLSDLATAAGLRVPELGAATQARLHELIAPYLRVSNPVDSGGHPSGDEEKGPAILDAILDDPAVDVLIVPIAGSFPPISDVFARHLAAAAERTTKPVCVIWGSPLPDEPAYTEVLLGSAVSVFRSARNCLTAVGAWVDWHAFRQRYASPFADVPREPSPAAQAGRRLLAGGMLSEAESKRLVAAYGIATPQEAVATSADEAVAAAERIGYPVVMKTSSAAIAHKSDRGLVRLGVASPDEVRAAYAALAVPEADGVLVAEQVAGATETILGVVRDELFGPVVVFGIGGVAVEVYGDVTFRVPPFGRHEAHRMIRELRGLPLLQGARGRPAADLDAVADAIMAVQRLALELADDLVELDINPLLAGPDGCVALDALAIGTRR